MLLEFRFHQLRPRCVPDYTSRFQQLLPARHALSPLAGFWTIEVGDLDQVVQLWAYEDAAHREQVLREAAALDEWTALESSDLHQSQDSQLVVPASFSPQIEPRTLGNVYELRVYDYEPGAIPRVTQRWRDKVPERIELSPLVLCGHSASGVLHRWFHLWAYKDVADRERICAEAVRIKAWPPAPAGGLVRQRNMLLVPSSFSPLR